MKRILGIDPGLSGALAFYGPGDGYLAVHDMPTHTITVNGRKRRQLDLHGLVRIIDGEWPAVSVAIVEYVHAMPKQGVSSSFAFGFAAGAAQTAVVAAGVPMLAPVAPRVWKKVMGLTSDKDASRRTASRLLPQHAHMWARVKDDGRAEATLLAMYGSTLT